MIDVIEYITLGMLAAAGALAVLRVGRSGSLPDKVLGLDTVTVVVASAIAAGAGIAQTASYIDALLVVTMLSFIGTITVARYVERRGGRA